jgi:hypothetical protein
MLCEAPAFRLLGSAREAEAARLRDDLEAAGCLVSATASMQ